MQSWKKDMRISLKVMQNLLLRLLQIFVRIDVRNAVDLIGYRSNFLGMGDNNYTFTFFVREGSVNFKDSFSVPLSRLPVFLRLRIGWRCRRVNGFDKASGKRYNRPWEARCRGL